MPILSRHQLAGLALLVLAWGINWPVMKVALRNPASGAARPS